MQLVVASPLTRTLETAVGVFGAGRWRGSKGGVLMHEQSGKDHLRAPHAAVAAPEGIRFVSFEGCRERLGMPHPALTLLVVEGHAFQCATV